MPEMKRLFVYGTAISKHQLLGKERVKAKAPDYNILSFREKGMIRPYTLVKEEGEEAPGILIQLHKFIRTNTLLNRPNTPFHHDEKHPDHGKEFKSQCSKTKTRRNRKRESKAKRKRDRAVLGY